jgi:HK97 family phage major capsid protein
MSAVKQKVDLRKIQAESQTRSLSVEVRAGEDNETIEFSFSSELPYERWWGVETLSHEDGAIDLKRLPGMNLLWNHSGNVVLGKILEIWVKDRKGYAKAKFSRNPSVQGHIIDIRDRIVTNVSVGYSIDKISSKNVDLEEYLVEIWTPHEISFLGESPADHTVGLDRSFNSNKGVESVPSEVEERVDQEDPVLIERQRSALIRAMGKKYGNEDMAEKLIEQGSSDVEARSQFADFVLNNPKLNSPHPVARALSTDDILGLSKKDNREYSLLKVYRSFMQGTPEHSMRMRGERTRESEISDELAKRYGREKVEGFLIPYKELYRSNQTRTINTQSSASGAALVATELDGELIPLFRNEAKVIMLGARVLSDLTSNYTFARQNLAATFAWAGENGEFPDGDLGFELIGLTPKNFGGILTWTRQQALQSSWDVELLARDDLQLGINLGLDFGALYGTGINNQPIGIANRSIGSTSVVIGPNGGNPSYRNMVNLATLVKAANADRPGQMAWLTNALIEGTLQVTPRQATGVEGNFILPPEVMTFLGGSWNTSQQVRSDRTKGSGTNLSDIFYGNFYEMFFGQFGALEIMPNTQGRTFKSGGFEIRAIQSVDFNIRHNQSFGMISDAASTF